MRFLILLLRAVAGVGHIALVVVAQAVIARMFLVRVLGGVLLPRQL